MKKKKAPRVRSLPAPISVMSEADKAAAALVMASDQPSKVEAMQFPTPDGTSVATTPGKETMRVIIPVLRNTTYDANRAYALARLQMCYKDPYYQLNTLANDGGMSVGSIGSPYAYASLLANAAIFRLNAVSLKINSNNTANLYKNGRVYILYFNRESPTGSTPSNLGDIIQHPQTKQFPMSRIIGKEYAVKFQDLLQMDFGLVNTSVNNINSNRLLFMVYQFDVIDMTANPLIQDLALDITLMWEFSPITQYSTLFDTKASLLTPDNMLSARQVADVSTAAAKKQGGTATNDSDWSQFKNAAKEVWGGVKKGYKFVKGAISEISSFFGLFSEEKYPGQGHQDCVKTVLDIESMIFALHKHEKFPMPAFEYETLNSQVMGTHTIHGRKNEPLPLMSHLDAIWETILRIAYHNAGCFAKEWLVRTHKNIVFEDIVWKINAEDLPEIWAVENGTLRVNGYDAAEVTVSNAVYTITAFLGGSFVQGGWSPKLVRYINGFAYYLPVFSSEHQTVMKDYFIHREDEEKMRPKTSKVAPLFSPEYLPSLDEGETLLIEVASNDERKEASKVSKTPKTSNRR